MVTSTESRRWGFRHWLMLAIPLGLLLVLALYLFPASCCRRRGLALNRAVLAELDAAGLGSKPSDLLGQSPPGDPAIEAQFRDLLSAPLDILFGSCIGPPGPYVLQDLTEALSKSWFDLRLHRTNPWTDAVPADVRAGLEAVAPDLDRLTAALRGGRPVLGLLGWARGVLPDPDRASFAAISDLPNLDFRYARALIGALALRTMAADDPVPALADLDRFATALAHPGTLVETFMAVHAWDARDQVRLALAVQGRLTPKIAATWLAEDPQARIEGFIADGLRSWRLLELGVVNHLVVDWDGVELRRLFIARRTPWGARPSIGFRQQMTARLGSELTWIYGPGDFALAIRTLGRVERAVRERRVPPDDAELNGVYDTWHSGLHQMFLPNLIESAISGQMMVEAARLERLAAYAILHAQAGGVVPADEAAFIALPPPGACAQAPGRGRIRYRAFPPLRFRLWVDPREYAPGWSVMARRLLDLSTTPPGKAAYENRHVSLEMDLAGLMPPGGRR